MRAGLAALILLVVIFAGVPPAAFGAAPAPAEARSPSITLDLYTLGGGSVGLVAAAGVVNLFNAAMMVAQGSPIVEALESGAGLPLAMAVLAVILGGVFGQDIVAQHIAPLFTAKAHEGAAPAGH